MHKSLYRFISLNTKFSLFMNKLYYYLRMNILQQFHVQSYNHSILLLYFCYALIINHFCNSSRKTCPLRIRKSSPFLSFGEFDNEKKHGMDIWLFFVEQFIVEKCLA
ncbi:hypothetical protein ACKWTF_005337 [Chironomus riparius]